MTEVEKTERILEVLVEGKLFMCEFYKVEWADGPTDYLAHAAYSRFAPFADVKLYTDGNHLMPRVIGDTNDPFLQFEIQSDIRTRDFNIVFDDIDGFMSGRFKEYKLARITVYEYYPQVDRCRKAWFGTLHSPEVNTNRVVSTTASNGWRMRSLITPGRDRGPFCPATFGRLLTTQYANETGLCPVNDHLGGTIGVGTDTHCPRLSADQCNARCGTTDGRYYGGWNIVALPYLSDPRSGFMAKATSNTTKLRQSIRLIAGKKHLFSLNLIAMSKEPNSNHPDQGFTRTFWEVSEGSNQRIYNIRVNGQAPNFNQWAVALGKKGQSRIAVSLNIQQNLTKTGLIMALNGLGNPAQFTPASLRAECDVVGHDEVAVWTNDTTYSRVWTDDIVWWLLEFYTNQCFGGKQAIEQYRISKFLAASAWSRKAVTFTHVFPDGENLSLAHRRATFNAIVEGQPFDELISNICKAGRISPPFQDDGQYSVEPLRKYTDAELDAAILFTDHGPGRNIVWENGEPSVSFSSISPDKLPNKAKIIFEDASQQDLARPITIDDPDQQLRAGRARGVDALIENPIEIPAFGINNLYEALKFGYGVLWFGALDSGGIKNNSTATFNVPLQLAQVVSRYSTPIKFDLKLAEGRESDTGEPFEYYRIMNIERVGQNRARITAQAYNVTAMAAFEIETPDTPPIDPPYFPPIDPPDPPICILTAGIIDITEGNLNIPILPC
jgi:hypothetical protein